MKKTFELAYYDEPELTFGNGQTAVDPRDGLLLFGPSEKSIKMSVSIGVVATPRGHELYKSFVERLQSPIFSQKKIYGNEIDIEPQRPSFMGFEATFGMKWSSTPVLKKRIATIDLAKCLSEKNKKRRTQSVVDQYASKIIESNNKDDERPDLWYVVVPRDVFIKCRYGSRGAEITKKIEEKIAQLKAGQVGLFPQYDDELLELDKLRDESTDFHNLLKAKLLHAKVDCPIQVVVETTLNFRDKLLNKLFTDDLKAHLAWTQSVAVYYKLGYKPWVLTSIRDEVCYLGLIFKKVSNDIKDTSVCSAAQMFLKDGDGTIFRGNIGLFKSQGSAEFHLDKENAQSLLGMALDDYYESHSKYPKELFIHGRVRFNDVEWGGFQSAIDDRHANTLLNGIVIKDTREDPRTRIKLFKDTLGEDNNYGVMRGTAWLIDENSGYIFTRGYIPRINTSNHLEIANPLYIEINRGSAKLDTVMKDILALTKLNYNACIYGDGLPVTLRFSDLIGNILTATSEWHSDMRQFRYYI